MSLLSILSAVAGLLWLAMPSGAVAPATVEHAAEADFTTGELHSTAVTSAGEVRLGRELDFLLSSDQAPNVVSALALRGKTLFAASGADNAIYRVQDGKADKEKFAAVADATMIGSLLSAGKDLLVGANGEKGGGNLPPRRPGQGHALLVQRRREVRLGHPVRAGRKVLRRHRAQGPGLGHRRPGQGPDAFRGQGHGQEHPVPGAGPDGTLYPGTDDRGLVVAIDPVKKTGRVLLSPPEKEISVV